MSFNTVAPLPAHPVAAPLDLARRLRKEDKSRFGLAVGVSPGGAQRGGEECEPEKRRRSFPSTPGVYT